MKCLTLFLHPGAEPATLDSLRASEHVTGFTVTRCEGHSTRLPHDSETAAKDRVMGFVPRVRIDVHLEDTLVDLVLRTVRGALGPGSQGHYSVTAISDSGSL